MTKEGRRKLFKQDPIRFACYGAEFKEEPKPKEEPKKKEAKK